MRGRSYQIEFAEGVERHLRCIDARYHRLLAEAIDEQLRHEPLSETRNRKPLKGPTSIGDRVWEIRSGPANRLRVFYEVDESLGIVTIRAVGEKRGNRLCIGGEEVQL